MIDSAVQYIISNGLSIFSLFLSTGVLTIYVLRYRQHEKALAEQRRQLENQKEQLETQQRQLEYQKQQFEQKERELEQFEKEIDELARQNELAELEHQIHIEVEDYEFEGDRVIVFLSNYGHGVATNLRLQTTVKADGPEYIQHEPAKSRLRRREGNDVPYEAKTIRPGEQRVEFEGEAIVSVEGPTGESHQRSLRGVLMDLRDADVEGTPTITFSVWAESLTQDEDAFTVTDTPLVVSIPAENESASLATAIEQGLRF